MSDDMLETNVTYEELAELEKDFDEVETEILRKQYALSVPLYEKRQKIISQIPNFWALVLEAAPLELDQYIQPSDSAVLASSLKNLEVDRFEIKKDPSKGNPHSVSIKFEFSENEWFKNEVLEKKFWFRHAKDGWSGLVSEPVKINWKKDKDLTEGLTDAAFKLWEAEKKTANGSSAKGKDKKEPIQEHKDLVKLVEDSTEGSMSFFAWFCFRGRDVSAEESVEAEKEEKERREKIKKGEKVESKEDDDDDDDEEESWLEREFFPQGEELAVSLSEDIWPGAIKYFTQAQEQEALSEADFEDDEDDDDDEEMNIDELKKLVAKKEEEEDADSDRPAKKRKA
ncbi:MAG: hypothetical protein M1819_005852 [Sarea resinae]|nr:MAG: hypothetical protein M1819_005852 [Sarea resinae]